MSTRPTAPVPPHTARPSRRRRWSVGCLVVLLLFFLVLGVAGYVCRRLWLATPEYWTSNQAFLETHDNATLMDMADRAEKRLLAEITDAGADIEPPGTSETVATNPATLPAVGAIGNLPPGLANLNKPRHIHLSNEEVNAWLAVKLDTWAANQDLRLPPQIKDYMISTEGQNLVVAFQYAGNGISQVISVVTHVDMLPGGEARLRVESLRGGELPLPKGIAMSQVKARLGNKLDSGDINQLVALVDGKVFTPVHKLDGARQIRLLDYHLDAHGADVTVQTELRHHGTPISPANSEPGPDTEP